MDINIQVNELMIVSMDMVLKSSLKEHSMKDNLSMVKDMVKVKRLLLIFLPMKGIFLKVNFKDKVSIVGKINNMKENSKIMLWMDKVSLVGQMEKNILDLMLMIKNMVMVY